MTSSAKTFKAPGRVNLIGEHTDYTGGLVLPMAIPFTTDASLTPADDGQYRFTTAMIDPATSQVYEPRVMTPEDRTARRGDWSDYPVGVLRELQKLGIAPPPFALHFEGDVPLGAGLSSSASVEVATAMALLDHAGATLGPAEIALLAQRAENIYVESPCGIMDQFAVTAAVAGHALLLNTRDLTYDLPAMNTGALAGCVIVVANSGVRHSVASGDYGVRRRELEAGQAVLRERYPAATDMVARDLGASDLTQLEGVKDGMSAESYKRCRHVITENGRVRQAGKAMADGDAVGLGKLMVASHASQRDDFQCSVPEIDFLVETAVALEGCFGARLTGGGFGGCTVNLVAAEQVDGFVEGLRVAYKKRFAMEAETYLCEAVDGAVARASRKGGA